MRLTTICAYAAHTLHIRICVSFISSQVISHSYYTSIFLTFKEEDDDFQESRNTYSFIANSHHNGASFECHTSNRRGEPVAEAQKNALHFRVSCMKFQAQHIKEDDEISDAPTEVLILGNSEVRMGESVQIQCRSKESNPAPKISWLMNGHPVQASGPQEELEQVIYFC